MSDILIVSVGSTVMQDDGIGPFLLQELIKLNLSVDLADLGTDIFKLRLFFSSHKLVIILDALTGKIGKPGDVYVFSYSEFKDKLEGNILNAHLLGVIEGIELMREVDNNLKRADIKLVGVVAKTIDKGFELTPEIRETVPEALQIIKNLMSSFI